MHVKIYAPIKPYLSSHLIPLFNYTAPAVAAGWKLIPLHIFIHKTMTIKETIYALHFLKQRNSSL